VIRAISAALLGRAATFCLSLLLTGFVGTGLGLATGDAHAQQDKKQREARAKAKAGKPARQATPPTAPQVHPRPELDAESRLIEIYKLAGSGNTKLALEHAQHLVKQHPNFQLAQLIYGDLLTSRVRPIRQLGDAPDNLVKLSNGNLSDLREESLMRIKALQERPPEGHIPAQFLQLSPRNRHAIAVDASRSRLYLFENRNGRLVLKSDFYISVGKAGIEKSVEGDLRTPLGLYYITSSLPRKNLKDFYGSGAMPINYPNPYDVLRGKTGSGIWLHGTPPNQFARPPKASDGCVVLANPDLQKILHIVEPRTTPFVIAQQIQWVLPQAKQMDRQQFMGILQTWNQAKAQGPFSKLLAYYTPDFKNFDKDLNQWKPVLEAESSARKGELADLKDLSILHWKEPTGSETMVVTFGEVTKRSHTGATRRQYWIRQGTQWKIFFEGIIG
jgi:murein L,D-transpeptidase YafK